MMLRYGAVVSSLRSLRGHSGVVELEPTYEAVPYRARAARGIAPLADVYIPANPTGASMLLVHGGGFVLGSRRMKPMRYLAAQLAGRGFAVCAIDYRMIFRGGRLAEALDDVRDGFAWWAARVSALGLRDDAISMCGLSAGGTLAMLAAPRLDRLASLSLCFGLYETDHLRGVAALLPRLLGPIEVEHAEVPTLLLHGSDDGLVPVAQAHRLAAQRRERGLPTKLVVYEGAPHGFFNLPVPAAAAAVGEIAEHATVR